ncbi:bifunctional glutamate N-acetyltransferase/amino-acid acetyltransferase ArgJ [Mycetocola reblochoni]|uniref:Arginine biosynthesis bifunctional protein ArgJ n=2 Tax=Mycetocola reblochoni TaxID=331618 RepID=A0A1R4IDP9_9MICO|nr:bifunctional glutamate N-acetyltransferase/amino-acid acetyltransferase ArgJ [Mycetocola reblochoni]RLP68142.1 bifunctional glutamate N-acetyltransferase/amino-acid acetyltransferase ArgJ [Mycetocola reblochoni]SJN17965.1 Glutamate N-acetyltransferase / N-acetylglutamate synthase [Mycetocola reblochoni REB411]
MSVTAAQGFTAAGIPIGLKSTGAPDLALVRNTGPSTASASVFTSNRCKANPVLWSERVAAGGEVSAIVLNSGGANCYTGDEGYRTTTATAEAVAEVIGVEAGTVLVCSTGLIGDQLDRSRLVGGVATIAAALADGEAAGQDAARAIMTTDSVPKLAERRSASGWTIGGMAKGAGMLAPGLATMLVVITTDVELDSASLDHALREATRVTFDRLDSDGCMSTNDTVSLLASGASGVVPETGEFIAELTALCRDLTLQLQADAEGADHDVAIEVVGAATEQDAVDVARAVSRSNLFKAAIFGKDPNWGRVLAAVGTTDAAFDPYGIDVTINGVRVCRAGEPDEPRDRVSLEERAVQVLIDLHEADAAATIWTNDLTHDYVHENSAYSS